MKLFAILKILSLLFLPPLFLSRPMLWAAEVASGPTDPPEAARIEQPAKPVEQQGEEDLRELRQRYGQDRTGVRARIGMCRRGHGGGHGNGHGGGYGKEGGTMHGPRHPCPYGEQPWNKQP